MAQNIGTLISAAIRPNSSLDPIASAFASEIKGGLHTASSSMDRNNIISERRDWGMLCYVVSEDVTYQLKYNHVDTNIMNNSNWVEFNSGSSINEWIDSVYSIKLESPATYSIGDRYLAGINNTQTLFGDWATYSPGVVFEWNNRWVATYPTNGMSVRVDDEDNSIYRYEGEYTTGQWVKENVSQIRSISINGNGVLFDAISDPRFDFYTKDMIFLSKFNISNSGTTASININSLGEVIIKKPSSTGLVNLIPGEIVPGLVYSLVYDGNYFQLVKHYSDGSGGLSIKYYIESNDYITVPPYHQYWVYGDLTIDGTLVNYGEVVIGNGSMIIGSGSFLNYGSLKLVTLAQGYLSGSSSIYFNDTETIEISEQTTITGLSVSANVKPNSLLPINLNTSTYSTPLPGYVLSSTNDGYFEWIQQASKLTVVDATPGQGITVSEVTNMVFIGGTVKIPVTGGTDSSTGVQALPGGQSYPSGTALVYIPKVPNPIYASFFNDDNQPFTNTNGLVTTFIDSYNLRISSPTTTNTPFSIGDWNVISSNSKFPSTIDNIIIFKTIEQVTGFSSDITGDSTIKVDFIDGDGITILYSYTTTTIYSNNNFADNNGSDNLVTINITNYEIDDSGYTEVYSPKWKAIPEVIVNIKNIFNYVNRDGGRYQVKITHKLDTATNYSLDSDPVYLSNPVFYDTNLNTPSINGVTSIQEKSQINIITKFISGVQYYTTGSEFTVSVTDITNLNRNTQGFNFDSEQNFRIKSNGYGLPGDNNLVNNSLNLKSWAPIRGNFNGWTNQFDLSSISYSIDNWSLESTTYRYRGTGGRVESQVYDPWGVSTINLTNSQNILVDCVQVNSSDLVESFNVENKRLVRTISGYSAWNSQSLLSTTSTATNGHLGSPTTPYVDAIFVGGELRSPTRFFLTDPNQIQSNLSSYKPNKNTNNPNYSNLTGTSVFHRSFNTVNPDAISSFVMNINGSFGTINSLQNALENSRLKIYVRKIDSPDGSNQYGYDSSPLSLHGDLYNFGDFNDGVDGLDNEKGFIRTGVSGNTIFGTFGVFHAKDGIWIEVQLVDNTILLTNITVSFVQ